MKKIKLIVYFILFASLFSGCIDRYDYNGCYKPKYLSYESLRDNYPSVKEPRELKKAGKIYVYGDFILINERGKGIHVVNNSNKEEPKKVKFIEIPGNIDLAVKDDYLYVDSFKDLVVLNIKDINNISEVYTKEDIFPYDYIQTLSQEDLDKNRCGSYDESRGVIVGYE